VYRLFSLIVAVFIFLFCQSKGFSQTDANTPLNGLAVYIEFPDVPATINQQRLDSLLNGVNYQEAEIKRTFRKYWYEQTRRNVVMHHDIFYYTAPKPSTYYDSISFDDYLLFWKDALESIIKNNPTYNWDLLTKNEFGGVSSVMIICNKYRSVVTGAAHYPNWTLSNGKIIHSIYGSVFKAPWHTVDNMFIPLHESAHAIFWLPDTYDTDYDSGGTSYLSLMSGGETEVEPIGGPFLVEKKWGTILEYKTGTHSVTLRADGDSVIVFRNIHDSLEYFTLEVRKQSTLGNKKFPVPIGLLIWHTDTKVSTSNRFQDRTPMKHYKHSILQADGLYEIESSISNGFEKKDVYLPGNVFNNNTAPNSKWWDGTESGIEIKDIQIIGDDKIKLIFTIPTPHTNHYTEIPQKKWKVISAPPAQIGYEPEKAIDGDLTTYYHVPWGNNFVRPHEFIIDLGSTYTINEFYYTANKNTSAPWEGRVQNYSIYFGNDTLNWSTEAASGEFFQTGVRQYVLFENKTGRYLKFVASSSFGDVRTSIAEINLRGYEASLNLSEIKEVDVEIYPNPTKRNFSVTNLNEFSRIKIIDLLGNIVVDEALNESKKEYFIENNGMYLVYLSSENKQLVKKLIIEN
jgi:M6 family metalloprotease-like protein